MVDFEQLGSFYLGKIYDLKKEELTENPLLYDAKNFTTHAVLLGMTGSGKTGLGIDIIEEAAIDGIPSIVIDPKGDLGNLLLTFPNLTAEEFLPWVDVAEAERQKLSIGDFAKKTAEDWQKGLEKWQEGKDRVKKFKNAAEAVIYTPASNAGLPLSVLGSFEAPPKEILLDKNALLERVQSITSSLLGLIGIDADPIKSKEHILLSTIINNSWQEEKNLSLPALISQVQNPPFSKIGALDLQTFYPARERRALSVSLNGLLASPGFQLWLEGESLDIQQLLYNQSGKPKISVISIAHLNDSERMFFVTLLLNQIISWMRKQPGTSSLRALFYMDEIFGFFPPTATPPSKQPMITLLKQARAYGLGVVLATQNPADLDYKGLSNCGTWFIGKLQTERDKMRVLDGLNAASNGEFDSKTLGDLLGNIGKRLFIMRSIYQKNPLIFETRWTLSYLKGPLTLTQIQTLKNESHYRPYESVSLSNDKSVVKPNPPSGIKELFFNQKLTPPIHYHPLLLGTAKLHFTDSKNQIDVWKEVIAVDPEFSGNDWEIQEADFKKWCNEVPLPGSTYDELPVNLTIDKSYDAFLKSLANFLYQNESLSIYRFKELDLTSKVDETEEQFKQRIAIEQREKRDLLIQKVKDKYVSKIDTLSLKVKVAEEKLDQRKNSSFWQKIEAFLSVVATVIKSLLGKRISKTTISDASTSMRRIGRIGKDSGQIDTAENNVNNLQEQLEDLKKSMNEELNAIDATINSPNELELETLQIKPRKSDITIDNIFLLWK